MVTVAQTTNKAQFSELSSDGSPVKASTLAGRSVETTKPASKGFFSKIAEFFKDANKPIANEDHPKPIKAKKEGDAGFLLFSLICFIGCFFICKDCCSSGHSRYR